MEKLYKILPNFLQNVLISMFNFLAYKKRYGGDYLKFKLLFEKNSNLTFSQLKEIQFLKFKSLLQYSIENSVFYRNLYKSIDLNSIKSVDDITQFPILKKEQLRTSIEDVYAIDKNKGIISKTGGTTGKSLVVVFTPQNMQERFAMLDNFRNNSGYKLGKKTAWFSGKNLLTKTDVAKNRFWKTDYLYKVRYYSTFHIKQEYLHFYIQDLIKFSPEYIVGFPSSLMEIANYGIKHKIEFPKNVIKAIYPTAETITEEIKETLELFFKSKVYDQYASSEGAPFIFECTNRNLHLELQSGVFEVLDDNNQPTNSGRLIITSFTTFGTPLIRYDIGDEIELSAATCNCGNNNPLVNKILGRIDDFIYSPENGKINLGNVSNTLKDTKGIVKFQAIQNKINEVVINLIIDKDEFDDSIERKFIQNWKDRIGNKMDIKLNYVDEIATEKSGKFRFVKNNIKDLL